MDESTTFYDEADLPLEILGYEKNTAEDVFKVSRVLDANLLLLLKSYGFVHRKGIEMTDGRILDGWVKI